MLVPSNWKENCKGKGLNVHTWDRDLCIKYFRQPLHLHAKTQIRISTYNMQAQHEIRGNSSKSGGHAQRLTVSAGRGSPFQTRLGYVRTYTYRFYWNTRCAGSCSCEPEAAESSRRDISMSPLHSFRRRSRSARQLSFVFSRRFCTSGSTRGLNIEASQGSVPLTGQK